ncbi:MAG: hypothetical protein IKW82_02560 [Bacteroidales bacterium]|nr:hypothetical protein [Bacteroidales bacterium]
MRRGGIEGPVVTSLFLLAVIIGLVAYVGRDNLEDNYDEPEWEETAPMVADSTETKVIFGEPDNIEIQEETPREKWKREYEQHLTRVLDLQTIE